MAEWSPTSWRAGSVGDRRVAFGAIAGPIDYLERRVGPATADGRFRRAYLQMVAHDAVRRELAYLPTNGDADTGVCARFGQSGRHHAPTR